jgi:5-methylthioadenosine/S-adenosylhomocysteine deaminase
MPTQDLTQTLSQSRFALAPDVLLTPKGVLRDHLLIVADGMVEGVALASEAEGEVLRLPGSAIIPGFVDTHTHIGQTFGKALIGGEPAQIWKRVWHPMEVAMGPHEAYVSAKWMCLEALRGGFTTLVNYGLNDTDKNEAVHRAVAEAGVRLVSACGLDEFSGDVGTGEGVHELAEILDRAERHVAQCAETPRVTPSLCCSSFHGNRPETLVALSRFCAERGIILQIHANEHFPEIQDCLIRFGKRPIEFLFGLGVLGPHVLLHHATLISEPEIEMLAATGTATSYNPLASIWKGNAVAPALRFAQRGIRFGIGSDNTSADAFRNLFAAEASQRVAHAMPVADFSCGAAWTWVDAATRGAADAARLGASTGSLAPGMAADFLILDTMQPECLPGLDFEWELVRYYNRDQVQAVVIDGALRALDGHAVGWDGRAFVREYAQTATAIASAPGITRVHGPSDGHRPR